MYQILDNKAALLGKIQGECEDLAIQNCILVINELGSHIKTCDYVYNPRGNHW